MMLGTPLVRHQEEDVQSMHGGRCGSRPQGQASAESELGSV